MKFPSTENLVVSQHSVLFSLIKCHYLYPKKHPKGVKYSPKNEGTRTHDI